MNKIEEMFDEKILIEKPISKIEKPLLNLPQNKSKLGLPNNEKDTIKNIEKLFKILELPESSKTLAVLGQQEYDSDSTINIIENQFNKLEFDKPNPTSLTRNWYTKLTPPDLQFEEKT